MHVNVRRFRRALSNYGIHVTKWRMRAVRICLSRQDQSAANVNNELSHGVGQSIMAKQLRILEKLL
jgi:hypothetical protein